MTCFNRMRRGVLFLICGFALTVAHVSPADAQDNIATPAATAVKDAAKKGFPLTASSTDVTGNVSVEAVLIPATIAKAVFGKEISNNYVIISLTISNRSSDQAFIVNTVFVDYSQWLLSGSSKASDFILCSQNEQNSSEAKTQQGTSPEPQSGIPKKSAPQNCNVNGNPLMPWQQQTYPNKISAVESRIVRGELLDRQPWTTGY